MLYVIYFEQDENNEDKIDSIVFATIAMHH